MDIKIKREEESNRRLDVPTFKSSDEINKEFDHVEVKEKTVIPAKRIRPEKHEDDLELTTQFITTELNTDSFDTLDVDTIDIENDLKVIEAEQYGDAEKRDEDTIKMDNHQEVQSEEEEEEIELPPRQFNINMRYVYAGGLILLILIGLIIGYNVYENATSQERFVTQALEQQTEITDINIYGESVNLIASEGFEEIDLYNLETKDMTTQKLGKSIDQQLHFSQVENGTYYMFNKSRIITSKNDLNVGYQTITRDGVNKDVSFKTDEKGIVEVKVATATTQKIDILIDASQGDIQGFMASDNKTTEQQLSLKYALALKSNLQQYGYNVVLTRDDDSVPGGCTYNDTYCSSGRVAMAYQNNPKLYITIGFNGTGINGFEITDSYLNSHTLARLIKSSISSSIIPSERVNGQLESGIFNKVYKAADGTKVDYLYLIRETGGLLMHSDNENASQFNTRQVGAEAIEVDPGYIGEAADFEKLNDDSEIDSFTKSLAAAIDQYINQY